MYSVSKAASQHLGRYLAMELAPRCITTNTISPAYMLTDFTKDQIEILGGESTVGAFNPLRRLVAPEDIAGVIVYLCSQAGAYINGVDITLDGGTRWKVGSFS
jgi:NAD(P)-dependent dehydrogenase (short-subunit alcohol dehydrogenase family)